MQLKTMKDMIKALETENGRLRTEVANVKDAHHKQWLEMKHAITNHLESDVSSDGGKNEVHFLFYLSFNHSMADLTRHHAFTEQR